MQSLTDLIEKVPVPRVSSTVHLGHRFAVVFLAGGVLPNPLDIRFQSVSGLSAEVSLESLREGGQNLYSHRLPTGVQYGNLVLKRGRVQASLLNIEFNAAMSLFKFNPGHVLIMQLNNEGNPIFNWLFLDAFPVRWSTGDLDATRNEVIVDTMELAYQRWQTISI